MPSRSKFSEAENNNEKNSYLSHLTLTFRMTSHMNEICMDTFTANTFFGLRAKDTKNISEEIHFKLLASRKF